MKTRVLMLGLVVLHALQTTPALGLTLADKPLILPTPMMPNVILTFDEARSMKRALPPFICKLGECDSSRPAKRYDYSAHYNPLYYNPNYQYRAPQKPDGTAYTTSYTNAYRNGYDPAAGTINLSSNYRPTFEFNPVKREEVPGRHPATDSGTGKAFSSVDDANKGAYYYKFKSTCNQTSEAHRVSENCYELVWVSATSGPGGTDERQNFANWYSFYRTRYLSAITALHLTMPKLEGKIRLGWQGTMTTCLPGNCSDKNNTNYDSGLNVFTSTHRDNFYKWLANANIENLPWAYPQSTVLEPIYRLHTYLSQKQLYCDNPKAAESSENPARSCRDNINVVITDGETYDYAYRTIIIFDGMSIKDIDSSPSLPSIDNGRVKFPMLNYTPRPPYMDNPRKMYSTRKECYYPYKNDTNCKSSLDTSYNAQGPAGNNPDEEMLADLTMAYWLADLVPSLDNDVIPYMPYGQGENVESQIWNPKNNPATWQHIVHHFVVTGMTYVLGPDWQGETHKGPHASGDKNWPPHRHVSLAHSHPSRIYDTWHAAINSRGQFYGADRTDELVKALQDIANRIEKRLAATAAIAANSTRLDTGAVVYQARFIASEWSGELIASNISPEGTVTGVAWRASMPAAGSRNIVVHSGSAAQEFTNPALLPADWSMQAGATGAKDAEVLAWLRGDQAQEQTFDADGNVTGGKYRKRKILLGDIVNSDPVFVGHQDYGYAVLPEGASDVYKDFVSANKARVKMLYVGANDGMLHGFAAGAGSGSAHVCGATLGQEVFAYIPNSARKRLPTLANPDYGRPGGIPHRYYVDGPAYAGDAFIGGQWRTVLLGTTGAGGRTVFALDVTNPCEFGPSKVLWERDGETWDADLGYTLAKPIIARLNDGRWAAVFGNGYGSGKAVLFVVDLQTGNVIKKFDLGGPDNGLSAPSLYDNDRNGTTDYVYAGDLKGRLWKFDLSSVNSEDWKVANGGAPLFVAVGPDGHTQPITAAPELGAPDSGSGVMVYFGTGRFMAEGDATDAKVQSLYGLLDNGEAIVGRGELVQQKITEETTVSGKKVRKTSANTVDYASKRGWYIDLDFAGTRGERVVSTPRRVFGRIFFTTLVPSADPCKFGGTSWLMEFDPHSGAMPATSVIDAEGEVVAGIMSTEGIVKSFEFLSGPTSVAVGLGSKGRTVAIRLAPSMSGMPTGRVSWREIID